MLRFCLILIFTAIFPQITSSNSEIKTEEILICKVDEKAKYLSNNKIKIDESPIISRNYNIFANEEEKKSIEKILNKIPEKYLKSLEKVKSTTNIKRRWLAWSRSIYLNFDLVDSDKEFERLLVHEVWHVIDLWYFESKEKKIATNFKDWTKKIYADDPSVEFYSICWENEEKQNWKCSELDFPSKYWKTDVFEDFAESFLLYVKNNDSFKLMTEESEVMKMKYKFFKKYFWKVKSWIYENQKANERVRDLTVE